MHRERAGGQVGKEATVLFERAGWQVVAHDRSGLDITDRAEVLAAVQAASLPRADREAIAGATAALALMTIAQRPLERLAERLEEILEASEGALFDATVQAIEATVADLSRIALRMAPA